jgi:hypothetical protein
MQRRKSAVWPTLSQARRDAFEAALKIVPTHDLMEKINADKLQRLRAPIARVLCDGDRSKPPRKALGRDDRYQGLRVELPLAKGAKVILRYNLSVEKGLTNGAIGTVVAVLFDPENGPALREGSRYTRVPDAVLVNFDGYDGPGLPEAQQPRVVPILPLTRYTKKHSPSEARSRKQIPLELAWAISAHKSRG